MESISGSNPRSYSWKSGVRDLNRIIYFYSFKGWADEPLEITADAWRGGQLSECVLRNSLEFIGLASVEPHKEYGTIMAKGGDVSGGDGG